ncbi:H-NS histone family protein [Massilia orientalis]|uniref:H-NS family nucleoid-associated regulatory protein n=1 Tax=Massilia orientalis TaxID=3050128 RepID=A0ACC7MDX6_9BURK|nr:H-NS histone family protein [Massilia sp. YIM B02787]
MTEGTASAASDDNELLSAMEELKRAQQRVAQLRQQSREKALAEVREKIKMYDLTPEEMGFARVPTVSQTARKKTGPQLAGAIPAAPRATSNIEAAAPDGRSQVKPKYRSPDGQHTWSGRGKPPLWMQPLLEAGAKKEDFLVD